MAAQNDILESYYPSDVSDSTLSSPSHLFYHSIIQRGKMQD